jgi:chorismate mutase/prephenate dehydratase
MTQELSEIRIKIDAIDNQVHDLLMERASLVSSVAAAKRKEGMQIVQPAREARMIRRLLKRHKGPLPEATIVRIWRELVGSVSLLQTGLNVAVASNQGHSDFWDMARNYFGSAVPMKKINGNSNTVSAVREGEVSFGVLPWPELETSQAWWVHLFDRAHGGL